MKIINNAITNQNNQREKLKEVEHDFVSMYFRLVDPKSKEEEINDLKLFFQSRIFQYEMAYNVILHIRNEYVNSLKKILCTRFYDDLLYPYNYEIVSGFRVRELIIGIEDLSQLLENIYMLENEFLDFIFKFRAGKYVNPTMLANYTSRTNEGKIKFLRYKDSTSDDYKKFFFKYYKMFKKEYKDNSSIFRTYESIQSRVFFTLNKCNTKQFNLFNYLDRYYLLKNLNYNKIIERVMMEEKS